MEMAQGEALLKVQQLQAELIELRQARMLEIDEIRVQFELEVAEAKQHLYRRERDLEQQIEANPQQVLIQNSELLAKVEEMETSE